MNTDTHQAVSYTHLDVYKRQDLLYDQGFTISGARNKMQELFQPERDKASDTEVSLEGVEVVEVSDSEFGDFVDSAFPPVGDDDTDRWQLVRCELFEIRQLLAENY